MTKDEKISLGLSADATDTEVAARIAQLLELEKNPNKVSTIAEKDLLEKAAKVMSQRKVFQLFICANTAAVFLIENDARNGSVDYRKVVKDGDKIVFAKAKT